jgi:hypothetical protein
MNAILQEAEAMIGLTQSFFNRNNPIESIRANIMQTVDYLVNFSSHRKLMKYRSLVYLKQLNKMETHLWAGVLAPEGDKIDRYF